MYTNVILSSSAVNPIFDSSHCATNFDPNANSERHTTVPHMHSGDGDVLLLRVLQAATRLK